MFKGMVENMIESITMNTYTTHKRSLSLSGWLKLIVFMAMTTSGGSYGIAFSVSEELLSEVQAQYGAAAEQRLRDWQQIISLSKPGDDMEKLLRVNSFVNRAHQVSRDLHWQRSDERIDPLQFLIHHAGDGQGFAMTKLFTLHKMGMPLSKLRIGYVRMLGAELSQRAQPQRAQTESLQSHTVLAYFSTPDAEPLILDNLDQRIRVASQRTDLEPIYLFEAQDILFPDTLSLSLSAEKPHYVVKWQNLLPNLKSVHY